MSIMVFCRVHSIAGAFLLLYPQIGLGWQSIIFVYEVSSEDSSEEQKCVILTGSEAVSR